jgi:predicted DNA-binding transcriptional regulator AlpA
MGRHVDTDDLLNSAEVAVLLGLKHSNSVTTYLHRYREFPRPVVDKSDGNIRLWLRQDVEGWSKSRGV